MIRINKSTLMKSVLIFSSLLIACLIFFGFQKDKKEPWSENQLLAPAELAAKINQHMEGVVIFNIGPAGKIKNAITIGATEEKANVSKLKEQLAALPKNSEIVIYCGCCPFEHCPNVRPAFTLLKEMHFTNARLLNLPKNLKSDWIDKGYPMQN